MSRRRAKGSIGPAKIKKQSHRVSMFARRLCLGSPGGEMSGEALLATPARPLYEPSHRPPKKDRPKSLSFCSDNTVTDDQQAAPVLSLIHISEPTRRTPI